MEKIKMEIELPFFEIEEKTDSYVFIVNKKSYIFKLDEYLECFPSLIGLFYDLKDHNPKKMAEYYYKKNTNKPILGVQIDYVFFSELEYYLTCMERMQEKARKNKDKNIVMSTVETENCSICLCDVYENIEQFNIESFFKNMFETEKNNPIRLTNCVGHYFHLDCLVPYIGGKKFIKCPVCSLIYGTMTGDGPDGKMDVAIDQNTHCKGYEKYGTIIINYRMSSGTKNGIHFPHTHRTAYLPDTKEGNEVLVLLKKAFDRKLIFIIGDSVTSGAKNVIVWNGIHHKTSLHGGSSHFGYPDETYFTRVKLELADKGVI